MDHEHPPQDKPKPPPLPPDALLEADEHERPHEDRVRGATAADFRRLDEMEIKKKAEDLEKARKISEEIKAKEAAKEKDWVDKWDETSDALDAWASDPKAIGKTALKGAKVVGTAVLFAGVTVGWVAKHPLGFAARTAEWGFRKLEDFFVKLGAPKALVEGMQKAISWMHKKTGIKEEEEKKGGGHDDHGKGDHGGHPKAAHGGGHGGGHAKPHGGGHDGGGHAKPHGGGGGHAKPKGGGHH